MARTSRRPATRRSTARKLPRWALVVIGLSVGALLMGGLQYLIFRADRPLRGIAGLFAERKASEPKTRKEPPAVAEPSVKPKFDFYTILPEIETVIPEREARKAKKATPAKAEQDVSYVLQAASYATHEDADRLKAKLALTGLEAHIEKVVIEGKGEFFRVRLGPYSRIEDLDAVNNRLAQEGIHALRIKVKKAPGA